MIASCDVSTSGVSQLDSGPDVGARDSSVQALAELRVLNLSPGGPNFDLRIGSRPILSVESLGFGHIRAPIELASGTYDFTFLAAGTFTPPLLSLNDRVITSGRTFSLVAFDLGDDAGAFFIENENHVITPNEERVRLVSTVDSLGPLNVLRLADEGDLLLHADMMNGDVSDPLVLPAGELVLGIDKNGDRNADHRFEIPPLPEFGTSIIYIIPNGADVFLFVEASDAELLRFDPSP